MKANELMIGDWVQGYLPDTLSKVVGILNEFRLAVVIPSGGYMELSIDDFQPIPLTPEILKKNGFEDADDEVWPRYVFVDDIEKCPQTIITFAFYREGISVETLFRCWTKPKCCDGENNIHICDLKYVHELQHALRLCGIDKEIVL